MSRLAQLDLNMKERGFRLDLLNTLQRRSRSLMASFENCTPQASTANSSASHEESTSSNLMVSFSSSIPVRLFMNVKSEILNCS